MKAKTKYNLIKWLLPLGIAVYIFIISSIFVLCNVDKIWGNMFEIGIENVTQFWTLILYRVLIYVPIPLLIGTINFDKRYKYSTRVIIWYNWMFLILLFVYGIYEFLAISLLTDVKILNSLSPIIILLGYIFTLIKKKKVDFSDSEILTK